MRIVRVPLGDRSYSIYVGAGLLSELGRFSAKMGLAGRCAVISDDRVARLYAKPALAALRSFGFKPLLVSIPHGETSKRLKVVESVCDQLAAHRLERKSFIVALGGGVVGDLAGFVAAIYLRGLPFVQVPTTLLSQVDSSVGGKVGVNLKAGKNLAGAFYQPRFVLCDLSTLDSLPVRELRAGLAEVIKYGVIRDAGLFARLERDLPLLLRRDAETLGEVIARCCELKARVVRQDETETGLRAILNFGHTIGHAIENISGYGKYLHGEAIAIGQVAAARLSVELTGLPAADAARVEKLLRAAGLPAAIQLSAAARSRLLAAMRLDKKVRDGRVKFVLARRLGRVEPGQEVAPALIEKVLTQ
jgi:3-dehydroquinate synthase